jgi:hypothetical protein
MTSEPYVVIRLVPESPADGTTLGTYLNDLSLRLVDANTGNPVTDQAFSPRLSVFPWPPGSSTYVTVASGTTSGSPTYNPNAYPPDSRKDLTFKLTKEISVGSFVVRADQTTIPASTTGTGLPVTVIMSTKVTLSCDLPSFVPPGTPVSFVGQPQGNVDLTTRLRPARACCPHATRTRRSHYVTAKAAAGETVAAIRNLGWTEGCDGIGVAFGSLAADNRRAGKLWRGAARDGR